MVTQTPTSRCSKSHRLVRQPESRDSRPGRQEIEKPRPAQIRIGAPSHVMKRSQLKAWFSAVLRKAKKKKTARRRIGKSTAGRLVASEPNCADLDSIVTG